MEKTPNSTSKLFAWTILLSIGILWGGTLPLAKVAVSTGYRSFGIIFWQLIIGIIILGGVLLWRGWRPSLNRQLIIYYCAVAVLGTLIPNGISYLAAAHLPAGVMSIAIATVPMFTLVIALGFKIEPLKITRILGVLVGFIAMALIIGPENSLPEPEKAIYVLLVLIAPLFYGIESNYIAVNTPANTDAVSTLFMASFFGLLIVSPLVVASGQWIDPLIPWHAPELALIAGSVIHAITYAGYIWLISFGGPVFSVQVAYPVTLSGVFLSIVFLGEGYSGWIWAALGLVIVALFLVQPRLDEKIVERKIA